MEAVLQKADCYGYIFVLSGVDEVDKGLSTNEVAAQVSLIRIEVLYSLLVGRSLERPAQGRFR